LKQGENFMNAAPLGPRHEALDVSTLAMRVFGDAERAGAWMTRPNSSLSGQRPLDLVKDERGTAVVRELLEQIDYGIFP
jgi:putative toxin-antitoxin system antitoxin component (TIGR02293 family)